MYSSLHIELLSTLYIVPTVYTILQACIDSKAIMHDFASADSVFGKTLSVTLSVRPVQQYKYVCSN